MKNDGLGYRPDTPANGAVVIFCNKTVDNCGGCL
jgi:hypothetical protein